MASRYFFPLAFVLNAFAMTGVLILLGLAGNTEMAAEVGIIQAATVALFYAFSANARSLILNQESPLDPRDVLYIRLLLILPLSIAAYFLSAAAMEVEWLLALALILRRAVEWLQEVRLSKEELSGNVAIARNYVIYQSILLGLLAIWILFRLPGVQVLMLLWALIPLAFDMKYILQSLSRIPPTLKSLGRKLMPHLGSSLIIGISVYVFRLLILLITGKQMAGDLFTAFAIGGIFGSVFANALGVSVVFNESKSGVKKFPTYVSLVLGLSALMGLLIFLGAWFELWVGMLAIKSQFFYMALGLSMIGGVLMVYAQRLRFQLLQKDAEHDMFGPDVLINLLIIAAVPLIAYTAGKENLLVLYFLSAILCLTFYLSAKYERPMALIMAKNSVGVRLSMMALAASLVMPVFFQIESGLFRDQSALFDSGGVLVSLPIPFSVFMCFVGIVILAQFRKATESFAVIFFTCILLTISTLLVTNGEPFLQRVKFLFLIQFLLPMFGLVLGQMFMRASVDSENCYAKGFSIVMVIIILWQLAITMLQEQPLLVPYLGLFSIYQHLDYVPVVFTVIFVLLLPRLWSSRPTRVFSLILGILIVVYLAKSMAMTAFWLLLAGVILFGILRYKLHRDSSVGILLIAILISNVLVGQDGRVFKNEIANLPATNYADLSHVPEKSQFHSMAVSEYFADDVIAWAESFFFGHQKRPARTEQLTVNSYYLDLAYNFGVIALLPLLLLMIYTLRLFMDCWRSLVASVDSSLLFLVVMFLVVVDNSVQVGLRQPYPGIFTFFLWGVLIVKLNVIKNKNDDVIQSP